MSILTLIICVKAAWLPVHQITFVAGVEVNFIIAMMSCATVDPSCSSSRNIVVLPVMVSLDLTVVNEVGV